MEVLSVGFLGLPLTHLYTPFLLPKSQMNATEPVFSKWIILGIPDYVFGSDKELYRLPFASWTNHYGLRRIKKQPGNRWRIGDEWWSERQLKRKIRKNPQPQVLIEPAPEHPF